MEPNNHTPRTSPLVAPSIENANNTKHSVRRGPGKKASKSGSGNRSQYLLTALGFVVILAVSFGFGLGLPPNPSLPLPYGWFSAVVGWAYFACWSISFYPQIYQNWRRKSVQGLSFDFTVYNLLGFGCYSIFNGALYFSEAMKTAYADSHNGAPSPVEVNDVFFSFHAFAATLITAAQCIAYDRGGQRVSEVCKLLTALALVGGTSYGVFIFIANKWCSCYSILAWLYLCSYVKLAITLFKYIPQIHLNFKRKSTVGWSITNCLLDLGGGVMSLVQVCADSQVKKDWGAITSNPVKFGLGFVSMTADVIIMVQHYILYREPRKSESTDGIEIESGDVRAPLLGREGQEGNMDSV